MPATKILRSRKARQVSRSSLRLECLESRLPLAGNVTAQLVGSTLFLTGDALANEVVVASAKAGTMAILGNSTTINGAATHFVTTKPVTSIVANLKGGNDVIGFGNDAAGFGSQLSGLDITLTPAFDAGALQSAIDTVAGGIPTFTLPGSLTVTAGDGNDFVGIIGNVGGSVVANLGSALTGTNDRNGFTVGIPYSPTVTSRVGGAVSVVGGAQNDTAFLLGASVNGGVSMALGNGTNNAFVDGIGAATIGSFAYAGGTGSDLVQLFEVAVRNGVNMFTGNRGKDFASLYETRVGGDVILNTGTGGDAEFELDDVIELLAVDVRGFVSLVAGTGNDLVGVSIGSKVGLGLAINTGDGNDKASVRNTYVDQTTAIDAGAGNDWVFSSGLTTRSNLFVHLGPGNDRLELRNVSASAAFLYGGTGTNLLATNPATRTGIRTLRYYQFQTVNNV